MVHEFTIILDYALLPFKIISLEKLRFDCNLQFPSMPQLGKERSNLDKGQIS